MTDLLSLQMKAPWMQRPGELAASSFRNRCGSWRGKGKSEKLLSDLCSKQSLSPTLSPTFIPGLFLHPTLPWVGGREGSLSNSRIKMTRIGTKRSALQPAPFITAPICPSPYVLSWASAVLPFHIALIHYPQLQDKFQTIKVTCPAGESKNN